MLRDMLARFVVYERKSVETQARGDCSRLLVSCIMSDPIDVLM